MSPAASRPRMLLVGGGGGLVGREIVKEFASEWRIRSVHTHEAPNERPAGVEWIRADVRTIADWRPLLDGVDMVLNVAWWRSGSARRFRPLRDGLVRLVAAAERAAVPRFVHLSVPEAPLELEQNLPYLSCKREVDRAIEHSSLSYLLLRPTLLFGPRDRLLTVMLRTMHRYHWFPIFGDGEYHLSPLASADLAAILKREVERPGSRSLLLGGPRRYRYRDLTDRMFAALGRPPRYISLSARGSVRLARLLESMGSHLIYAYEVTWLLSDMLGLPPYAGWERPLTRAEPFLDREGARLEHRAPPPPGA